MVLVNALDETMEALRGNDEGKYIEERALLRQVAKIVGLNKLYSPIKKHFKSGIDFETLNDDSKKKYVDFIWLELEEALYEFYPEQNDIANFKEEFESEFDPHEKTNRLASLQNHLITYFIEKLKINAADGNLNLEEAEALLKEYEELLIEPNSVVLNIKKNNIGLEESVKFFYSKKQEYKSFVESFSVVK